MKIAISYPPIINSLGQKAMVSQNRNVQYFLFLLIFWLHMRKRQLHLKDGHDVYWDDGNAQLKNYQTWLNDLIKFKPDLIILKLHLI